MIHILQRIFPPIEGVILIVALFISTAIFPDLKESLITLIGHRALIVSIMDILIKLFIGTTIVGSVIVLLTLLLFLLSKLIDSISLLDKAKNFFTTWVFPKINYRSWNASGSRILFDSVLWCASFMALRFYWDDTKGTGKTEMIAFLQYIHNQYSVTSWIVAFAIGIPLWIVGVKILDHDFK